jgi:cation diffusion facilitator family transporter
MVGEVDASSGTEGEGRHDRTTHSDVERTDSRRTDATAHGQDSREEASDEKAKRSGHVAVLVALSANIAVAAAKYVAWFFTGSASMLAEALHSTADTGNQGLLLIGEHRARRPADRAHPFGYGRERYFWGFVVALVLFSLGSLFSLVEAGEKLRHPHELDSVGWAVATLSAAMVFEGVSLRTAVRRSEPRRGQRSWFRFVRGTKEPELPVVLLEDSGALVGLLFALTGVLLAWWTGNPRWDALGSLAIGLLLGVIATFLAIEMKSLLIGEAASPEQAAILRSVIEGAPNVEELVALRTLQLGPDSILVAACVHLDGDTATAAGVVDSLEEIERRVRARLPEAKAVFVEPR